jgi:alkylation response protein AidB-like acyl-CoA dehydrogenase
MLEAAEHICQEASQDGWRLIEMPAAQARLARTFAHVEITRMIACRALWCAATQAPDQAIGAMVKLFSAESFRADSADLLDLTAPRSLFKRSGPANTVNLAYRHAHGTTVYGGTSEVHRSMIAERNLGLPRSRAR